MQIGRYEILDEIARGGMGAVFRAREPGARRHVAVKVLLGGGFTNPVATKRFAREAAALARVQHPNVVRVSEFDTTERGEPFLVMELIEGESLQARLDRYGALDVDTALEMITSLCAAVEACHGAGVLHRDLKPDNVLIAVDGTLKLTDFGLARDVDPSMSRSQLSVSGKFIGSPGFWSPEQAEGKRHQIGPRTDVYGLGATLFALLTGQAPHQGASLIEILVAVRQPKPAPSELNPLVPEWLDDVVGRALAIEPEDRFPGPAELANALDAGPRRARAAAPRTSSRPVGSSVLAVAALIAVAVVTWVAAIAATRPDEPVPPIPEPVAAAPIPVIPVEPISTPEAARADPNHNEASPGREHDSGRDSGKQREKAARLVNEAVAAAKRNDSRLALARFNDAVEADPTFATAYSDRGTLRHMLGDPQRALADFNKALELDPTFASAYVGRGNVRASLEDHRGAAADYTKAIGVAPRFASAYVNRGAAKSALDDLHGAVADYTTAIDLDSNVALPFFNRGVAKKRLGDYRGALDDFNQAIDLTARGAPLLEAPKGDLHWHRGSCKEQLGRFREAIEDFTISIREEPRAAYSLLRRGVCKEAIEDFPGAIEDYTRVLEIDPEYAEPAYLNRGVTKKKSGDPRGAARDFQQVLELNPQHAQRAAMQAFIRRHLGDQ